MIYILIYDLCLWFMIYFKCILIYNIRKIQSIFVELLLSSMAGDSVSLLQLIVVNISQTPFWFQKVQRSEKIRIAHFL